MSTVLSCYRYYIILAPHVCYHYPAIGRKYGHGFFIDIEVLMYKRNYVQMQFSFSSKKIWCSISLKISIERVIFLYDYLVDSMPRHLFLAHSILAILGVSVSKLSLCIFLTPHYPYFGESCGYGFYNIGLYTSTFDAPSSIKIIQACKEGR